MANSLRDELLKAGLVDETKVKRAKKARYKQDKQRRRDPAPPDPAKERARQAMAEKAERDRALNREREEKARRIAAAARVRQLVEAGRVPREEGEVPFNFVDGGKVKRILVTGDVHARLAAGRLHVVRLDRRYELVQADAAEKIRREDPARVMTGGDDGSQDDDAYAEHPVPDDLTW